MAIPSARAVARDLDVDDGDGGPGNEGEKRISVAEVTRRPVREIASVTA